MTDKLSIAAYRTHATHAVQIQISQTDENGAGLAHRLAGPKHYNMGVTKLVARELDKADAREIRSMLDAVFPAEQTVYRAEHDSIPIGTFTTREVARQACEQQAKDSGIALDLPHWAPADGDPLADEELCVTDESVCTNYFVVPVPVLAAYDPGAEG